MCGDISSTTRIVTCDQDSSDLVNCEGFNFSLNLLVIISLINYRRTRRHVTTPFIISLSVLDLVYAGLILPVYAARFGNRETPLSEGLCQFFPVAFYGTMGASLLSLTMVSLQESKNSF